MLCNSLHINNHRLLAGIIVLITNRRIYKCRRSHDPLTISLMDMPKAVQPRLNNLHTLIEIFTSNRRLPAWPIQDAKRWAVRDQNVCV